jgi:hypothetical protein
VKLHRSVTRDKVKFLALGRWRGTLTQQDMPFEFIKLTDQLDFCGVSFLHTFAKTRQVNCDMVEKRVQDTVNPWRGGKFLPIVERGHSVNVYGYSKAFFRCHSIPLRRGSEARLLTMARSWMLQDTFPTPSRLVLHRTAEAGGLGLQAVGCRALACLARTFLELAVNPQFLHSIYLEDLYRTEVLGEWSGAPVPPSPYYSKDFFDMLRHLHRTSHVPIGTMTIRQLTRALTEQVTHGAATADGPGLLLPVWAERGFPDLDWPRTWRRARLRGLPGDLADHLFRHLHGLLPTQDRLAEMPGANRGERAVGACRCCEPDTADSLLHSMFGCAFTAPASAALLVCVRAAVPGATPEAALHLSYELEPGDELPVVTLLATAFHAMWESCRDQRPLSPARLRAVLLTRAHTLSRTRRYQTAGTRLRNLVTALPT